MSVTIKDIAAAAGVSRGTVDRVLHKRMGVNPEVAQRVRLIADELGFAPNMAGKILAARKQPIKFGCLLPDVGNPFFDGIIAGFHRAEKELSDFGVSLHIEHIKGFDIATHIHTIEKLASMNLSGVCIATMDIPEVQVTGSFHIRGHNERIQGFIQGLIERKSSYTVLSTFESLDDDTYAYETTMSALEKYPETNCIFIAAAGVEGVCKAVDRWHKDSGNRKKPSILSFDDIPATKRLVKDGFIDFTICQEPEQQGYMAVSKLFSYLMAEKKCTPQDYITSTIIKIKENI